MVWGTGVPRASPGRLKRSWVFSEFTTALTKRSHDKDGYMYIDTINTSIPKPLLPLFPLVSLSSPPLMPRHEFTQITTCWSQCISPLALHP